METLLIVSDPKGANKADSILKDDKDAVLISLNDSTSSSLKQKGIEFRTINDFVSKKESRDLIQKSGRWLREWSNKSRIKDITYRNISVWWFFDFWLYYSFFKWDMVKNICWYIDIIRIILKKTKPKKVTAIGNSTLSMIISQLHPEAEVIEIHDRQHIKPYLIDYGLRAKHLARKWLARIYHRGYKPGYKDILFTTYTSNHRPCVKEDGNIQKEDAILGYVVRRAQKRYKTAVADIDFTKNLGIRLLKEKRKLKENIPFEYYFSRRISSYAGKKAKEIRERWKELDDKDFRETCVYEKINIYALLKPWLEFVFRRRISLAIDYIETALEMIDREDPDLVFVVDETAIFGRSVITAARLKGLPTAAIQHGYITPDAVEYMHIKGDISDDLSIDRPYCPIADKTVVYGPYTKEILTRPGNYPEYSVAVTGQPRYDCFEKKVFSRDKVFRQFRLDRKKKLILWTTQDVPSQEEVIFNAVKNIKDAQLLVKLHPRELAGVKPYYEKAREMGIKIKAVQEGNTFEMISACDVMITMHSTTGLEAIMMSKPIVVLNISGKPDHVPYVSEGAALGVYKPENLEAALSRLLFDRKAREEIIKKSKEYSYRHSYKMDGKATQRVMNVAENLMKQGRLVHKETRETVK